MLFDETEGPPSKEELAAVMQSARSFLRLWKKRALYSASAFLLSCASLSPFLYGHPLHAYWDSFGKYLVLVSIALLVPFVACAGIAINSWFYLRTLKRIRTGEAPLLS